MKKAVIICLLVHFSMVTEAQKKDQINRSCSVACINGNWIPDSYEKGARCSIRLDSKGIISIHETNDVLDKSNHNKQEFIKYKIAILKKGFDSIISFSDKTFTKVDAQEVLQRCEKGDKILVILVDLEKYSLPHHFIDVI